MKYLEFTFQMTPSNETMEDVLSAVLAEVGFDSFVNTGNLNIALQKNTDNPEAPLVMEDNQVGEFKAYIKKEDFNAEALNAVIEEFPLPDTTISYTFTEAEDKDWNEEWEKNYFQPLVVDGRCVISSTFHKDTPTAEYNILIDPRMSFGTGHHATTSQMISELLEAELNGLNVLDMGCGTSILAILARMRGAAACTAIDIDEWCVKNSLENIGLNKMDGIEVFLGDASALEGKGPFDLIIANINRNILLADMRHYLSCMAPNSSILMSGFYIEDIPSIRQEAERNGLHFDHARALDGWACVKFKKKG